MKIQVTTTILLAFLPYTKGNRYLRTLSESSSDDGGGGGGGGGGSLETCIYSTSTGAETVQLWTIEDVSEHVQKRTK